MTPAPMERREDVLELVLIEPVQEGDESIEFRDQSLSLSRRTDRPFRHSNVAGPRPEAVVDRRESCRDLNKLSAKGGGCVIGRHGEPVEYVQVHVQFHEPAAIPIEGYRTKNAQEVRRGIGASVDL